jgi:hypothetical protein
MSVVMLKCEAAERGFSSGILTDECSFRSLPNVSVEADCPTAAGRTLGGPPKLASWTRSRLASG